MRTRRWHNRRPEISRLLPIILAAVLTPLGYLSYTLAVRSVQGNPLYMEPYPSSGMLVYFLVLALTGVVTVLGWEWGLRFAPVAAVGSLLIWPWLYVAVPIGSAAYASLPFAVVLILTALEGGLRYQEWVHSLTTDTVGRYALAVGLLHFVVGFGVQVYIRRFFWLEYSPASAILMGLIYVVSGLALVATGALSVHLWTRRQLITPAVAMAGWFGWGVYGTWTMRAHLPLGHFTGINWMGLTPSPDYLLKWPVLVIALVLSAGVEVVIQKVGRTLRREG